MRDGWVTDGVGKFSDGWDKCHEISLTHTHKKKQKNTYIAFRGMQLDRQLSNRQLIGVMTACVTKHSARFNVCVCCCCTWHRHDVNKKSNVILVFTVPACCSNVRFEEQSASVDSSERLIAETMWEIAADKLSAQAANHRDIFKTFSPFFHSADFLPLMIDPCSCLRCKCQLGMSKV